MSETAEKISKVLKRVVIIIVVIGMLILSFFYWGNYSSGERVGKMIKLSKRGVVFKTWEGQLGIEAFGAVKGTNQFSQTFEFSVYGGSEVLDKLSTAMNENRRVNLKYSEKYIKVPWRGDTKYLITDVVILDVDNKGGQTFDP